MSDDTVIANGHYVDAQRKVYELQAKLDEITTFAESESKWAKQYMDERDTLQAKLDVALTDLHDTTAQLVMDDEIEQDLRSNLDIAVEALRFAHKEMVNMKNHKEIDWSFHYHTLDNSIILPALKKLEE